MDDVYDAPPGNPRTENTHAPQVHTCLHKSIRWREHRSGHQLRAAHATVRRGGWLGGCAGYTCLGTERIRSMAPRNKPTRAHLGCSAVQTRNQRSSCPQPHCGAKCCWGWTSRRRPGRSRQPKAPPCTGWTQRGCPQTRSRARFHPRLGWTVAQKKAQKGRDCVTASPGNATELGAGYLCPVAHTFQGTPHTTNTPLQSTYGPAQGTPRCWRRGRSGCRAASPPAGSCGGCCCPQCRRPPCARPCAGGCST
jgi:hypothetical protein